MPSIKPETIATRLILDLMPRKSKTAIISNNKSADTTKKKRDIVRFSKRQRSVS